MAFIKRVDKKEGQALPNDSFITYGNTFDGKFLLIIWPMKKMSLVMHSETFEPEMKKCNFVTHWLWRKPYKYSVFFRKSWLNYDKKEQV